MKVRWLWLDYLVFLGVRLLAAIFDIFPIEWNLRTARIIGWIWFHLPGPTTRHRQRAIDNIRLAYGEQLTPREIERIACESMQHLVMFAVEFLQTPRLVNLSTWGRYLRLVDLGPACRVLLSGRGCIMLTAHYGSFELLGFTLAMLGFPIVALMRPFDNEYLNRLLVARRRAGGMHLLYKKGAIAEAPQVIRDGKALCFIADQDAGRKGIFVDFFGEKASTYKSIALLAMEYRVPIIVGCARRVGRGFRYDIIVNRIIEPAEWEHRSDDLHWITQEFSRAMEDFIRVAPEQYLWIHRRWKTRPRQPAPPARVTVPGVP